MNRQWKSFLYYSKQERNGIMILLLILIALLVYKANLSQNPPIQSKITNDQITPILCTLEETRIEKQITRQSYTNRSKKNYPSKGTKLNKTTVLTIHSSFDPNDVTEAQLTQIGLPAYVIKVWKRYLDAGARFKTPEDVSKIYGLSSEHYKQLLPYINIAKADKSNNTEVKTEEYKQKEYVKPQSVISLIDLNVATPDELLPIYGIGPSLSKRIIKFRDKLGGFYDITQLKEVFGMPDSTYLELADQVIIDGNIQKIAINLLDIDELKEHPYIDYNLAKAIVKYRSQHGMYKDWEDVMHMKLMKEHKRLKPYISY